MALLLDGYADELRLRQVIISTLGQAIFCMQDFGTIKISASVKKAEMENLQI